MRPLYRALFPCESGHFVLGRKLRPFSNWHRVQLEFAKSPLLGFPGDIDVAALAVAVSVCVTRHPERFQAPRDIFEFLLHRLAVREALRDPRPAFLAWKNYLRDYSAVPPVFHKQNAKACQCPAPLAMWAALKQAGFSKSEAWDEPVGEAAWEKIALAEREGADINLRTDKARAALLAAGYGKLIPHLLEEDE